MSVCILGVGAAIRAADEALLDREQLYCKLSHARCQETDLNNL
jgi:hypothetical protein